VRSYRIGRWRDYEESATCKASELKAEPSVSCLPTQSIAVCLVCSTLSSPLIRGSRRFT
jgi:hypothetical protein